jgi:hypothetical protein
LIAFFTTRMTNGLTKREWHMRRDARGLVGKLLRRDITVGLRNCSGHTRVSTCSGSIQ